MRSTTVPPVYPVHHFCAIYLFDPPPARHLFILSATFPPPVHHAPPIRHLLIVFTTCPFLFFLSATYPPLVHPVRHLSATCSSIQFHHLSTTCFFLSTNCFFCLPPVFPVHHLSAIYLPCPPPVHHLFFSVRHQFILSATWRQSSSSFIHSFSCTCFILR